jgi:GNAT superfamily N-acetyltransferase
MLSMDRKETFESIYGVDKFGIPKDLLCEDKEDTSILYHATDKKNLPSILKRGLVPSVGKATMAGHGSEAPKLVYFTDDLERLKRGGLGHKDLVIFAVDTSLNTIYHFDGYGIQELGGRYYDPASTSPDEMEIPPVGVEEDDYFTYETISPKSLKVVYEGMNNLHAQYESIAECDRRDVWTIEESLRDLKSSPEISNQKSTITESLSNTLSGFVVINQNQANQKIQEFFQQNPSLPESLKQELNSVLESNDLSYLEQYGEVPNFGKKGESREFKVRLKFQEGFSEQSIRLIFTAWEYEVSDMLILDLDKIDFRKNIYKDDSMETFESIYGVDKYGIPLNLDEASKAKFKIIDYSGNSVPKEAIEFWRDRDEHKLGMYYPDEVEESIEEGASNLSFLQKYKDLGASIFVFERDESIVLSEIRLPKELQRQGIGSAIMTDLIKYSEEVGKPIFLTPDTSWGTSKSALLRFYKSFGFVFNKGKNKNWQHTEVMVRPVQEREIESVDEGANGDWKKEGITLDSRVIPHGSCDYGLGGMIVTAHDKNGTEVGTLEVHIQDNKTLFSRDAAVDSEFQRKGIATAMYQYAERKLKRKFRDSRARSKDADGLWSQPNRPFGEGINGDWKKEGYKISVNPNATYHRKQATLVTASHPKYGKVGEVYFGVHPDNLTVYEADVNSNHQRKGLASAMYDAAEKFHNLEIQPASYDMSDDAKEFWKNRLGESLNFHHPFGEDTKPKCPKCGSSKLMIEKRTDGDAHCRDCDWHGPYRECLPKKDQRPKDVRPFGENYDRFGMPILR